MPTTSYGDELLAKMKSYSERVKPLLEYCDTEEQTKISFINPFIEVLDHDVRDPRHVRFEYTVDVRLNKEKVDYAIFHEGHPTIFVEAKAVGSDLSHVRHLEQIRSYANQTDSVKFLALTNGVNWHWFKKELRQFGGYTLEEEPFLTHNVLKPGPKELSFLRKICGRGMDVISAEEQALETRLLTAFEDWLTGQLMEESLDDELIAHLARKYVGTANKRNLGKTRRIWIVSINNFVEKKIEERLQIAQTPEKTSSTVSSDEVDIANVEPESSEHDSGELTTTTSSREFKTESGLVVLESSKRARAWRPKGESNWRIEKYGNDLFVSVLRFLASKHALGSRAFYELISLTRKKVISNDPIIYTQYRTRIELGYGYYLQVHSSNVVKDSWLKDVAQEVAVKSNHYDTTELVEWWL